MKHLIQFLIFFSFSISSFPQKTDLKTWPVMKDIIGMEASAAEALIKSHGYKYDRSFEGLGVKFKEFSKNETANYIDKIVLGNKNGAIDLIKFEFIKEGFENFEKHLQQDNFIEERETTWEEEPSGFFVNKARNLKIRYDLGSMLFKPKPQCGSIYILRDNIDLCFKINESARNEFCNAITSRESVMGDYDIQHYIYDKLFLKYSCVPDSFINLANIGILQAQKIQLFWNLNYNMLRCDIPGYNLSHKSLLLYAIQATFNDVLYSLFKEWKLDPNLLYNGRNGVGTMLDFAQHELDRRKEEVPNDAVRIKNIEKTIKVIKQFGGKSSKDL